MITSATLTDWQERCERTSLARHAKLHRFAPHLLPATALAQGQLVVAKVLAANNGTVVRPDGTTLPLRAGMHLLAVAGSTHALMGRCGGLPESQQCHLLNAQGLAGLELEQAQGLAPAPVLELLGSPALGSGSAAFLSDLVDPPPAAPNSDLPTVLSLGCAPGVGEGDALEHLVEGLAHSGYRKIAVLMMGSWPGATLPLRLRLAGAHRVLDGADAGWPDTTLLQGVEFLQVVRSLQGLAHASHADICVLAFGGGFAQASARELLEHCTPLALRGAIVSAMDALSARTAVHSLQRLGIEPIVVTGLISESPLAMREAQPLPCPIQSSTDLRTTAFTL